MAWGQVKHPLDRRNLTPAQKKAANEKVDAGRSRGAFDGGFYAQTEAKLAASTDANVGQGKARAQESQWAASRGQR